MSIDSLTNNETFKVLATIVTGSAGVAWYRERRKTKKDAYTFAMDLLSQQNTRIDSLVKDMARLEARVSSQADAMDILKLENSELKIENARLKTALGEHGRQLE